MEDRLNKLARVLIKAVIGSSTDPVMVQLFGHVTNVLDVIIDAQDDNAFTTAIASLEMNIADYTNKMEARKKVETGEIGELEDKLLKMEETITEKARRAYQAAQSDIEVAMNKLKGDVERNMNQRLTVYPTRTEVAKLLEAQGLPPRASLPTAPAVSNYRPLRQMQQKSIAAHQVEMKLKEREREKPAIILVEGNEVKVDRVPTMLTAKDITREVAIDALKFVFAKTMVDIHTVENLRPKTMDGKFWWAQYSAAKDRLSFVADKFKQLLSLGGYPMQPIMAMWDKLNIFVRDMNYRTTTRVLGKAHNVIPLDLAKADRILQNEKDFDVRHLAPYMVFFKEQCKVDKSASVITTVMYEHFQPWARARGYCGIANSAHFGRFMKHAGFLIQYKDNERWYVGLRLKTADELISENLVEASGKTEVLPITKEKEEALTSLWARGSDGEDVFYPLLEEMDILPTTFTWCTGIVLPNGVMGGWDEAVWNKAMNVVMAWAQAVVEGDLNILANMEVERYPKFVFLSTYYRGNRPRTLSPTLVADDGIEKEKAIELISQLT